jgi:hypothetical protein
MSTWLVATYWWYGHVHYLLFTFMDNAKFQSHWQAQEG